MKVSLPGIACHVFPMGDSLSLIIQDTGVMQKLHTDNAPEMVGRKTPFFARARKEGIDSPR